MTVMLNRGFPAKDLYAEAGIPHGSPMHIENLSPDDVWFYAGTAPPLLREQYFLLPTGLHLVQADSVTAFSEDVGTLLSVDVPQTNTGLGGLSGGDVDALEALTVWRVLDSATSEIQMGMYTTSEFTAAHTISSDSLEDGQCFEIFDACGTLQDYPLTLDLGGTIKWVSGGQGITPTMPLTLATNGVHLKAVKRGTDWEITLDDFQHPAVLASNALQYAGNNLSQGLQSIQQNGESIYEFLKLSTINYLRFDVREGVNHLNDLVTVIPALTTLQFNDRDAVSIATITDNATDFPAGDYLLWLSADETTLNFEQSSGSDRQWATSGEKYEGSSTGTFTPNQDGDFVLIHKTAAVYSGTVFIVLGEAGASNAIVDTSGTPDELTPTNLETRIVLRDLKKGTQYLVGLSAGDSEPVDWCVVSPFYNIDEPKGNEYDHISINGDFDLTTHNSGSVGMITTSNSLGGDLVVTYGTVLKPQTKTLEDGETATFVRNGVTGWLLVSSDTSDIYKQMSSWTRSSNSGAIIDAPIASIAAGRPSVIVQDNTNNWQFYLLTSNLPLGQDRVVKIVWRRDSSQTNTAALRVGVVGGSRDLVFAKDTGDVKALHSEMEIISNDISEEIVTTVVKFPANTAWTHWQLYPAYSVDLDTGSTANQQGSFEIIELDLNHQTGEKPEALEFNGGHSGVISNPATFDHGTYTPNETKLYSINFMGKSISGDAWVRIGTVANGFDVFDGAAATRIDPLKPAQSYLVGLKKGVEYFIHSGTGGGSSADSLHVAIVDSERAIVKAFKDAAGTHSSVTPLVYEFIDGNVYAVAQDTTTIFQGHLNSDAPLPIANESQIVTFRYRKDLANVKAGMLRLIGATGNADFKFSYIDKNDTGVSVINSGILPVLLYSWEDEFHIEHSVRFTSEGDSVSWNLYAGAAATTAASAHSSHAGVLKIVSLDWNALPPNVPVWDSELTKKLQEWELFDDANAVTTEFIHNKLATVMDKTATDSSYYRLTSDQAGGTNIGQPQRIVLARNDASITGTFLVRHQGANADLYIDTLNGTATKTQNGVTINEVVVSDSEISVVFTINNAWTSRRFFPTRGNFGETVANTDLTGKAYVLEYDEAYDYRIEDGAVTTVSDLATAAATLMQSAGAIWAVTTNTTPATGSVHLNECEYTQVGKIRYYNVLFTIDQDGVVSFGVNGASQILSASLSGGYSLGGTAFEMPGNQFRKTGQNQITFNRDDDNNADNQLSGSFIVLMS